MQKEKISFWDFFIAILIIAILYIIGDLIIK